MGLEVIQGWLWSGSPPPILPKSPSTIFHIKQLMFQWFVSFASLCSATCLQYLCGRGVEEQRFSPRTRRRHASFSKRIRDRSRMVAWLQRRSCSLEGALEQAYDRCDVDVGAPRCVSSGALGVDLADESYAGQGIALVAAQAQCQTDPRIRHP